MGILDRLFGGRFTMPPPEETNLSASAIMKELRPGPPDPAQKKALETFAQALLAVVPEKEGARLVRRVMRRYAMGDDACSAFTDGLLDGSKAQKLEHLVLMSLDWKGFDVFEYQAPYLVSANQLKEPYVYTCETVPHQCQRCLMNSTDGWFGLVNVIFTWTPVVKITMVLLLTLTGWKRPLSWPAVRALKSVSRTSDVEQCIRENGRCDDRGVSV